MQDEFHLVGVDLGRLTDPTVCMAARKYKHTATDPDTGKSKVTWRYRVRGIRRFPLGTLYTSLVPEIVSLVSKPPLDGCQVGIDRSGVGGPVVELLRKSLKAGRIVPISITAGASVSIRDRGYNIAKQELIAPLLVVIQSRRLEIPDNLDDGDTLRRELANFAMKVTDSKNVTYEALRESLHDDCVIALAILIWLGERLPTGMAPPPFVHDGGNTFSKAKQNFGRPMQSKFAEIWK